MVELSAELGINEQLAQCILVFLLSYTLEETVMVSATYGSNG